VADRAPNKTLNTRRCIYTSTTVRALHVKDCLDTLTFTIRSVFISRSAIALPLRSTLTRRCKSRNKTKTHEKTREKQDIFTP
jgi:hypothetical protein